MDAHEIVSSLQKASSLNPDSYGLSVELGTALASIGRFEDALVVARNASSIEPARYEAWVLIGDSAFGLKDYVAAMVAFKQVISKIELSKIKHTVNSTKTQGGSYSAFRRLELLTRLHLVASKFDGKEGAKQGSILVQFFLPIMKLLGVNVSLPGVNNLLSTIKQQRNITFLRPEVDTFSISDIEEWWLLNGEQNNISSSSVSSSNQIKMMEEEEDVSDRIATQNSKLYSIYLKLGISYYRALLNFKLGDDDFPQIEFGDIIKKSDTDLGSDAFVEAEGENCN